MQKTQIFKNRITIVLIILIVFLIGAIFSEYNKLSKEHRQLIQDYETLTNDNKALIEKSSGIDNEKDSFIQSYYGMKYPVTSGLRRYTGEEPLRIYPSSKAPYVFEDYKPEVVELINEVGMEQETWCLVLDSRGVSGYAHRSDLVTINEEENSSGDYGSAIETLGGFKIGERIETLIGVLDRDYYLIYENGRIYEFPDKEYEEIIDPMDRPFSNTYSLDAFVSSTNHISLLRTDSPEFPLKDGYKVGDNAIEVLDFYASKYDYLEDRETYYWYSDYTFITEAGHMLQFYIDTEELNKNSIIRSIWIDDFVE